MTAVHSFHAEAGRQAVWRRVLTGPGLIAGLMCVCALGLARGSSGAEQSRPPVEFYRDILPVLEAKCLSCHGGSVREGGLSLDLYDRLLQGGDGGPAIVPGKPDDSLLVRMITGPKAEMPPVPNDVQAKPCSAAEIALIRKWIEAGAPSGTKQGPTLIHWHQIPQDKTQVYSLALSPDRRTLAAGHANRIALYDLLTRRQVHVLSDPRLSTSGVHPGNGSGSADWDLVLSMAFSPDGRLLASSGYRNVKIWERVAARELNHFQAGGMVREVKTGVQGQYAAMVLETNEVEIWNLNTAQRVRRFRPHDDRVVSIEMSPHENWLITADQTGLVRMFDIQSGAQTNELKTGIPVTAVGVRTQGPELVTAHTDGIIRVWPWSGHTDGESMPVLVLPAHAASVTAISLLTRQQEVLSGSEDGSVRIWSFDEQRAVFQQSAGSPVVTVAGSADGERVIASCADGQLRLWNRAGTLLATMRASPDESRSLQRKQEDVAIAGRQVQHARKRVEESQAELHARQKRLQSCEAALTPAREQVEKSRALVESATKELQTAEKETSGPDAKETLAPLSLTLKTRREHLATDQEKLQSAERTVQLARSAVEIGEKLAARRQSQFEAATARQSQAAQAVATATAAADRPPVQNPFLSLATWTDDDLFIAAGEGNAPGCWSLSEGKPLDLPACSLESPALVTRTLKGGLILIGRTGKTVSCDGIQEWKLQQTLGPPQGALERITESRFVDRVTSLAFRPDGKLLATGGGDPSRTGELLLWDLESGGPPTEIPDAHSDTILDLEFSRDGNWLVTGGADKFCRIFDLQTRQQIKSFEGHSGHVLGVALCGDGETLVSASADCHIKVWDVESGEARRTIENYSKQVASADFLGTTETVLSCSGDGHVKLHDITNGQNTRSFVGASDFVHKAIGTGDASLVVAAGEDGIVRLWNGTTGDQLMTFTPRFESHETAGREERDGNR
jgi:WD40 repeat protein